VIKKRFCSVYDVQSCLLARAPWVKNRLYLLKTLLAAPVCLVTKAYDVAWLWHGRYGHLNFKAVHDLGAKEMVEGMPGQS
jgi:hypothetical protein